MEVEVVVRKGDEPGNEWGRSGFLLHPRETHILDYGDTDNVYLDGYRISGDSFGASASVGTTRGNELDNMLNMNNSSFR